LSTSQELVAEPEFAKTASLGDVVLSGRKNPARAEALQAWPERRL